jgi:serine/threonine protein kinase
MSKVNQFTEIRNLGSGSFGSVKLVQRTDSSDYFALKTSLSDGEKGSEESKKQILSEQVIFSKISRSSPFVVKLHDSFVNESGSVSLLLGHAEKGDLYSHLKQFGGFSVAVVRYHVAMIADAMSHLHSLHIVHRDLKPDNLLLDKDGFLLLSDFGLAKQLVGGVKCTTFVGSPLYMSPEMVLKRDTDKAIDSWAFGVTIYELLTAGFLFNEADSPGNLTKVFTNILRTKHHGLPKEFSSVEAQSPDLADLIKKLLAYDPNARLTMTGCLQHSLLQDSVDMKCLRERKLSLPIVQNLNSSGINQE